MQKIDFNKGWMCKCLTRDEAAYPVTLPHDAMLSEPRTQESTGEGNIGWYIGGDYEYTKKFTVPKEYENQKVLIEFEGVYHNAEVHINGKKVAGRPYGYTNFYINTIDLLQPEVIHEVALGCLTNYGMGAHKPKSVKVEVSEDNARFESLPAPSLSVSWHHANEYCWQPHFPPLQNPDGDWLLSTAFHTVFRSAKSHPCL